MINKIPSGAKKHCKSVYVKQQVHSWAAQSFPSITEQQKSGEDEEEESSLPGTLLYKIMFLTDLSYPYQ